MLEIKPNYLNPPPLGFTLIELLLTLAITAALLTLGLPNFQRLLARNEATSLANHFLVSIHYARSEAIKHNLNVQMCSSENQRHCSDHNDWAKGWIIFLDPTGNGQLTDPSLILRSQGAQASDISLIGPTHFRYTTAGYLSPSNHLSVKLTVGQQNIQRWICLTAIGKATVKQQAC
jgi:type IV fimbrial biogenesis protein FimT